MVISALKYPDLFRHFCERFPLPVEEWQKLEKMGRLKKIKKKQVLIRPGDKVENYIVTVSGLLRMFYTDDNGNEFIKAFRDKNEMAAAFGELVLGIPAKITVAAIEDTEVLEVPYKEFQRLSKEHECWDKLMLRMLTEHFLYKEQREYELLLLDAAGRYESFKKFHPGLVNRVPQYQIASYLGVTPVTLSRLQSKNSY